MSGERTTAVLEERLEQVIELLQYLVALELSRRGTTHQAIGKRIHVAKATVGKMLSGTGKDVAND
jgi:predicted transcriptional regulator